MVRALNTSGRAVLFAGATVCIALLGLLVLGLSFLTGMGIGAAIAVVFTVLAAVTLLPALLGFFGMQRAQPARTPQPGRRLGPHGGGRDRDSGALGGVRASVGPQALSARRRRRHGRAHDPVLLAAARHLGRRATTRPAPPPARPTTCWRTASAPASTARCSWWPRSRPRPIAPRWPSWPRRCSSEPGVAAAAAALPAAANATTEIISVVPTTSPQDAETSHLDQPSAPRT